MQFESLVPTIPLPVLPDDPAPGFYGALRSESTGHLCWRLLGGIWWVSESGQIRLYPPGVSWDNRSSPWGSWNVAPPSVGTADRCWLAHDIDRRTYRLTGLKPRTIDLVEFPAMMRSEGKSRFWAATQGWAVRLAWCLGAHGKGNGWYETASEPTQYDTPVFDHDDGLWKPLSVWVSDHYRGDGTSYRQRGQTT